MERTRFGSTEGRRGGSTKVLMKSSKRLKMSTASVGELGFVGGGEEYNDGVCFRGCGGVFVDFERVWLEGPSSILTEETLRDMQGLSLGAVVGDRVGNVKRKEEDKASITDCVKWNKVVSLAKQLIQVNKRALRTNIFWQIILGRVHPLGITTVEIFKYVNYKHINITSGFGIKDLGEIFMNKGKKH